MEMGTTELAQIVLSAALVLVTIAYVILTHRMANTAETARKQAIVPHLIADLQMADGEEFNRDAPRYVVRVLNAGPGIALDVEVTFSFEAVPNEDAPVEERRWRTAALLANDSHVFFPPATLDGKYLAHEGRLLDPSEMWTAVRVSITGRRVDGKEVNEEEAKGGDPLTIDGWRRLVLQSGETTRLERDPVADAIKSFERTYRNRDLPRASGLIDLKQPDPVRVTSVPDPWLIRRMASLWRTARRAAVRRWTQFRGHRSEAGMRG